MLRWMALPLLLLCAAPALAQQPKPAEERLLSGAELLAALKAGGLNIYFRHARTDWSERDQPGLDPADCAQQRNLSAEGREQARASGEAIKRLGVPIGRVLASPLCRTRQHAEIGFGRVEIAPDFEQLSGASAETRAARIKGMRAALAAAPAEGNTVIVGHQASLRAAAGLGLEEGEAVVFRPGPHGPVAIGRVRAEEWAELEKPR